MNLKEAYETLELAQGTSPDDAKKQYRKLTKEWHPDVNKAPEAEAKFKRINEAYECIKNGKGNDREAPSYYNNPFHRQQVIELQNVEVYLTIDFKESVIGCKKEVHYSRQAKCPTCNGNGEKSINNGCTKCGGSGRLTVQQRGMVFISTCPSCTGRSSTEPCTACNSEGTVNADVSVHVSVPAGIINGNILRLQGMGNYAGSVMGFMDQHTDAFCHISVKPEEGLSIDGTSVVSSLTIPLLDAILGCKRMVKTIHGNREITIKPESRNRDEVIISHCGVGGTGDQRVILDVQYPKNTNKLVGALIDEVT